MSKHQVCEPYFGSLSPRTWYIYDNYYQMLVDQTSPGYRTKLEAQLECNRKNKQYKHLGITKNDRWDTKQLEALK